MIRETLLASAILLLLAFPLSAVATSLTPSSYSWNADLVSGQNVSLGGPISVLVWGPPRGSFEVTLNGTPPLSASTVFAKIYVMPATISNASLGASDTVAIPTGSLTYGGYVLGVWNVSAGFEFAAFAPKIVPAVNASALLAQMAYLEQLYNITLLRQENLDTMLANEENMVTYLEGSLVAVSVGCVAAVLYVKTGDAWGSVKRLIDRARDGWHEFVTSSPNSDPYSIHSARDAVTSMEPDPNAVFVSRMFPDCLDCRTPRTEAEAVMHLREAHKVNEKTARANVTRSVPTQRAVVRAATGPLPSPRSVRAALKAIPEIEV